MPEVRPFGATASVGPLTLMPSDAEAGGWEILRWFEVDSGKCMIGDLDALGLESRLPVELASGPHEAVVLIIPSFATAAFANANPQDHYSYRYASGPRLWAATATASSPA